MAFTGFNTMGDPYDRGVRDYFSGLQKDAGNIALQADLANKKITSEEFMQGRVLDFQREDLAEKGREFDITELFRRQQLADDTQERHHEHELYQARLDWDKEFGMAGLDLDKELGMAELDLQRQELSAGAGESAFMRELLTNQHNLNVQMTAPLSYAFRDPMLQGTPYADMPGSSAPLYQMGKPRGDYPGRPVGEKIVPMGGSRSNYSQLQPFDPYRSFNFSSSSGSSYRL